MSLMTVTCEPGGMPIGLIPLKDAVSHVASSIMDGSHKWYALYSDDTRTFRSKHLTIPAPLVIATTEKPKGLNYEELMSHDTVNVTSRVLFARDNWECQYCEMKATPGNAFKVLTVDHVMPARLFNSRGEATTWENVTTACRSCNERKGGHRPGEVRGFDGKMMLPKRTPKKPSFVQVRFAGRLNGVQRDYVSDYFGLKGRNKVSI